MAELRVIDGLLYAIDEDGTSRIDCISRTDGGGRDVFRVQIVGDEVHLRRDMPSVPDDGTGPPSLTLAIGENGAVANDVPGGYRWRVHGPTV
jgi:hypothetical protein